jgi:hypothetical protein
MHTIHVYFEHLGDRVTLSRPCRLKKSRTLSEIVGSFPPACTHTPLCVRGRAGDRNSKTEKERECETELGVKGAGGAIPMRAPRREFGFAVGRVKNERTHQGERASKRNRQNQQEFGSEVAGAVAAEALSLFLSGPDPQIPYCCVCMCAYECVYERKGDCKRGSARDTASQCRSTVLCAQGSMMAHAATYRQRYMPVTHALTGLVG